MVDTVLGVMRARYRTLISAIRSLEKQREKQKNMKKMEI